MEVLHVSQGIYTDKAPDDANNKSHDDRELVDKEGILHIDRMGVHQLKIKHQDGLQKDQACYKVVLVFYTKIQDKYGNHHLDKKHKKAG